MLLFLADVVSSAQETGTPGWFNMVPLLVIVAIFYFVMIRPQIKQQKAHQKLIDNITKGDKVVTSGGIWAEVDAIETNTVRLKINDKTKILVSRSNIASIQPKPGLPAEDKAKQPKK